jgi:hypothetical protein
MQKGVRRRIEGTLYSMSESAEAFVCGEEKKPDREAK